MSGMFEPKTDKASRKIAQTQKEIKEKKKKRIRTVTVLVVLVLVSAIAITINSSFIRRTLPVVRIDGRGFTTAEFEYFFNAEYNDYVEYLSQFQGMEGFLPDPSRPLSGQIYDSQTGETWADFVMSMALANMTEATAMYHTAKAAGFQLSQEQRDDIDDELEMVAFQAMISRFPSSDALLQRMFGNSMNERVYRNILEFLFTARFFSEHIRESFVYSSDSITSYYMENRDELDVFNFRLIEINIDTSGDDFLGEDDDDTVLINTPEAAREKALQIAAGIINEADFLEAAREEEGEYFDPDASLLRMQGAWIDDEDVSEWLTDDSRSYGDVTVIDVEYGSLVVFFISRDENNYRTTGFRQILLSREDVLPEDFMLGNIDPEYLEALENAEIFLNDRANEVYALFEAAGKSEQALLDLMDEYTDDGSEGGIYTDIALIPYQTAYIQTMRVVKEIEDWLFDESRQVGDTELILTEAFGYHLVYFVGTGDVFSTMMAEDRMRTRDHTEWIEGLSRGNPSKTAAFILVNV